MSWEKISDWLSREMARPLFHIAGSEITLLSIIIFAAILLVSVIVSKVVRRMMARWMGKRFENKEGTLAALQRLVHYLILFIGLGIALETVGINMNALFTAGAVFAVAVGFAMQNIMQNFVSGIILLMERSIKPGDVLEVEGHFIKIIDMGIRTTVAKTQAEEEIIIPNSLLSQSTVKNFTLHSRLYWIETTVGVAYASDMNRVIEVLESTIQSLPWRIKDRDSAVQMAGFGPSSVDFRVRASISDPWKKQYYLSELNKAVWFAFKEAGIAMAFPQVDVHLDPSVESAIGSLAGIG